MFSVGLSIREDGGHVAIVLPPDTFAGPGNPLITRVPADPAMATRMSGNRRLVRGMRGRTGDGIGDGPWSCGSFVFS